MNDFSLEPQKHLSKELAEKSFMEALRRGDYVGGQPIKESVLAKQLGLARTGVREMLNQAIYWGIVEYLPYSGFRIRHFSLQDALDWCVMREALEPVAARCFAERRPGEIIAELEECQRELEALIDGDIKSAWSCDIRFHTLVVKHCGNSGLADMHQRIYGVAQLYLNGLPEAVGDFYRLPDIKDKLLGSEHSLAEFRRKGNEKRIAWHTLMLDALKSGDGERAELLFRSHLRETAGNLRQVIAHNQEKGTGKNGLTRRKRINSPRREDTHELVP